MHFQEWPSLTVLAVLFVVTVAMILIAFEAGLRLGRWRRERPDPEPQLSSRMIIASVLGLLSFLLGFTFGIAATHFDARNRALDDEAGSILTAYHLLDSLAEPEQDNLKTLLREYVNARLAALKSSNPEAITQLQPLQDQLWSQTMAALNHASKLPPATLLQTMNEVTHMSSERVLRNMQTQIRPVAWFFLYVMTMIAITAAGYHSGLIGNVRHSISAVAYALAFSLVLVMIADVDNPRFDQLQENRQAFIDLWTELGAGGTAQNQ